MTTKIGSSLTLSTPLCLPPQLPPPSLLQTLGYHHFSLLFYACLFISFHVYFRQGSPSLFNLPFILPYILPKFKGLLGYLHSIWLPPIQDMPLLNIGRCTHRGMLHLSTKPPLFTTFSFGFGIRFGTSMSN